MPGRTHTDREYEARLSDVRERLCLMGGHVEEMISESIQAVVARDTAQAEAVIGRDSAVNRLEKETDDLCLQILARWQPMASDLRFVTLAMKMVTDLERIGDLAVNICERAVDLSHEPTLRPYQTIPRLAELARAMVHDAINAFVDGDAQAAQSVIARDDEVDALYARVFEEILELMREDPGKVQRGIHVQSIAKWLERMADHATNLAEEVVWLVRGQDIRHAGKI